MQRMKSFLFPAIVILGLAGFALINRNPAVGADYRYEGEPEVVAASFVSAWCSSCKILQPRLASVMPDFADKPVKFVELDFTFGQRKELEEAANSEGLAGIYPQFKGATGFTVLVDRDTGEIIDTLTINHSPKAMRAAIAQAIARASVSVSE